MLGRRCRLAHGGLGHAELLHERDRSGILAAAGTVNGVRTIAFCTDGTVMGGAMGVEGCQHIVNAYDLAISEQSPIVGIWHSGGARLAEGVRALHAVGLVFEAGTAGSRLSAAQRQKVGMARVLLRRPDVLILNEAFAALDSGSQGAVIDGVLREMDGRAVIAVLNRPSQAVRFGRVAVMRGGRMVEEGVWADLNKDGTALRALLDQE